ncbi:hypothetical protein BKA67DRAFT_676567 [Truncatella angustata]|uniref:Helicase C-terminal domain-containing protein n=1 Tax=Truncatella angustata TaxID=152316 RepID=A0A9P8UL02_9PEZI|nr:uncharacterized protein BKA67DRAFT_676567 [Truncatella angustata]KAH6654038.1 hypothetical protein BKA67DRAFT_676567 [Truncatella angustata]
MLFTNISSSMPSSGTQTQPDGAVVVSGAQGIGAEQAIARISAQLQRFTDVVEWSGKPDLDLTLVVGRGTDDIPQDDTLSNFVEAEFFDGKGKRLPHQYDVEALRKWFETVVIGLRDGQTAEGSFRKGDDIRLLDHSHVKLGEPSWRVFLTRVMAGTLRLPIHVKTGLGYIEFHNPNANYPSKRLELGRHDVSNSSITSSTSKIRKRTHVQAPSANPDDIFININDVFRTSPTVLDEPDPQSLMNEINPSLGDRSEIWTRTCRFFQCPEDTTELHVAGINAPVKGHQLEAAYAILTQMNTSIATIMLSDAMGLGKTLEVFLVIVLFHQIKFAREQRLGHLPADVKSEPGLQCPLQDTSPFNFVCPCNPLGDASMIARVLPDLPSIITVLPGSMGQWVEQWDKFVVQTASGNYPHEAIVKLLVEHPDFPDRQCKYIVELTHAFVEPLNRGTPSRPLWDYKTSAGNTIPGNWQRPTTAITVIGLGASFMFLDESHRYSGAISGAETEAIRFLRTLRMYGKKPVLAVPVSGELKDSGPAYWWPFLNHALDTARDHKWSLDLAGINEIKNLKPYVGDYQWLAKNLHRTNNKREQAELKTNLRIMFSQLLSQTMIARKQSDMFQGRKIVNVSEIEVSDELLQIPAGLAKDAIDLLNSRCRLFLQRLYDEQMTVYARGEIPKPTHAAVQSAFLDDYDHISNMRYYNGQDATFLTAQRSTVCPAVAELSELRLFSEKWYEYEGVKDYMSKISNILCNGHISGNIYKEIETILANTPWWSRRSELYRTSTKLQWTKNWIERNLLQGRALRPLQVEDGDHMNVQHAVIFTDNPLDSFLTFMLLYPKLQEVDFMLLHAHVPTGPRRFGPSLHHRSYYSEWMSRKCPGWDSPPKVLITSYNVGGFGLNLQRANNVILLTEAPNPKVEAQAIARVMRLGQRLPMRGFKLRYESHAMESVRCCVNNNKLALAAVVPEEAAMGSPPGVAEPADELRGTAGHSADPTDMSPDTSSNMDDSSLELSSGGGLSRQVDDVSSATLANTDDTLDPYLELYDYRGRISREADDDLSDTLDNTDDTLDPHDYRDGMPSQVDDDLSDTLDNTDDTLDL